MIEIYGRNDVIFGGVLRRAAGPTITLANPMSRDVRHCGVNDSHFLSSPGAANVR